MGRLDGRVAIITGAARGQGAAEARLFVAEGARVVVADVLEDEGAALAAELGDAARFVRLDVRDETSWASAVEVAASMGALRVLVNNAAIHWTRPIEHETADGFRRIWEVNLLGPFLGIKAVTPALRANGGGSIVNISSSAGIAGLPFHGAYGSTKWGLRGLSRTAAVELGPDNIRVNSVHPGPIRTDMLFKARGVESGEVSTVSFTLPLRRAGEPEEVANLVLFLASDESSYVNGAEITVDGGSMAGPAPTYDWTPPEA
jgi:3alpha(or 20beta)-hydroxysteroid dehydrogenase